MDIFTEIQTILGSIIPTASLETLAIDVIPRPLESAIYTVAVQASAFLETAISDLTPLGANAQLLSLLGTIKADIDGVIVPPAGSAILRLLPKWVPLIQAYAITLQNPQTAASRAVAVSVAPAVQNASQALLQAQAAQIAALQQELAKYQPTASPDSSTDAGMLTPGMPGNE